MADPSAYLDLPTEPETRGYKRLADFMAWEPPTAIFPRFRSANLLNLLSLQAEISQLEEQLLNLMKRDDQDPNLQRRFYSTNWSVLQADQDGGNEQRLKLLELRTKLGEYNTALIQQITLFRQPNPRISDLEYLQNWLADSSGGNRELVGKVWITKDGDNYKLADKLSLLPEDYDTFTRTVLKRFGSVLSILPALHVKNRTFPPRQASQDAHFTIYSSSDAVISIGDKVATIVASLVTTIPIIILKFVPSINWRLGLVVIFTAVFSSTLAFMSNAKRAEVFGASAAFAAVQVVFVGSVSQGNGTSTG
ncbi:hypothetical protein V1505DRAFT_380596 [Lipomyces doorenjongii]